MPDYMYILESRLSAEQRAAMMRVQELAAEAGLNLYLTGGAVRDLVSGMSIRDLDFTVEGNPTRVAHESEKGGAQIVSEDEKLRQIELVFPGNVDGSISAAREDVYARPGTRSEVRWSTIMEDLRRRDFSINAIALSLNAASRGLLLDPTNGLADVEKREVRALSIHSFTNQPVRLLRLIRYAARMDFKLDSRTDEWFALAMERNLAESIPPEEVGRELRQLGREEKPAAILKAWEARGLIGTIHPQLVKRHPDYETLGRIIRARDEVVAAGLRPRLFGPITAAVLGRLKSREISSTIQKLGFRSSEANAVLDLEAEAQKAVKVLAGRKTASPKEAYTFLEQTPPHLIVYLMAEASNAKVANKMRNYLNKWRPLRHGLPAAAVELEALGVARGPKFDKIIADLFALQLDGKGRSPEDRTKLLRKLAGIKEEPKKKEEKKKSDEKLKKRLMDKDGKTKPTDATAAAGAAPSPASGGQLQGKKAAAQTKGASAPAHAAAKAAVPVKKPAARTAAKRHR
jgi:tRNA nucleotidyltransferase (CCA-adding enzyme)